MRVLDSINQPVVGAGIMVMWSGLITGTTSRTTSSTGQVVLTSSKRTRKAGTITVTVTSISPPASYQCDASLFSEPLTGSISASK